MSSRRARTHRNREHEIDDLISKLQALLPASSSSCNKIRVPPSKILEDACNYIKNLRTEGVNLGERLSQLLEDNVADANTIRDLLQQ